MPWAEPEHSREEVDQAGKIIASPATQPEELDSALDIINNWRASHYRPLNTFQVTLRRKVESFSDAIVAQRVKRLRAIQHKLRKHTISPIPLSCMQDIAGCRAILKTPANVRKLDEIYRNSDIKHQLVRRNDYISEPKPSGYRGIHLVYGYNSDRKKTYNGLQIEIQLRTQLQHAWATAVEVVGFFRQELLKSSEGDNVWKHFFKLMAAEIAFQEKAAFGIPGIPSDRTKLREQLRRCSDKLDALPNLRTIGKGVQTVTEVETAGAHYFLLELDTLEKGLKITGYKLSARAKATMDYAAVERTLLGSKEHDAVLVSAQSMAELKRAYTNYWLDMHRFIEVVESACSSATAGV